MAYTINKYNGEELIVLEDGTIDTSTSIGLVGRNYVGYGETQNENFVFILENFANDAPPSRPLTGQLWFNTSNNLMNVYDGISWSVVGAAELSDVEPDSSNDGALWLRTTDNTLYVWNGTGWTFIGPETAPGFGTTRCRSGILKDINGKDHAVIFVEIDGIVTAVCSSTEFTVDPSNSVPNVSNNIIVGINLSNVAKLNGSITGNAENATRLKNVRLINGVAFDGQQDITIKASTTKKHIRGTYLVGSDFDGSSDITWAVDASSSNQIGKVVARDSQGNFSAGTITADIIGNISGDVTSTGTSRFDRVEATIFVGATLTGNAFSANQFSTPRKINGVSFDGTKDIIVPAAAATLTGSALNPTVTASSLTSVGTLSLLSVADAGISVGSGNQLQAFVDSGTPTIRSNTGKLNFDIGESGPDVSFVNSSTSLLLGGPNAPAIVGDNTTNLGIPGYKFDKIYANELKGNADSATTAITSTNIAGGGPGSIPYQTAAGTTTFLNIGANGYVLRARTGNVIQWEALNFEQLNKGIHINMINPTTNAVVDYFNSSSPVTISVDATASNTANKLVVRDNNGDFSAGTVTANLAGNVTGDVTGNLTGNVTGNVTGNLTGTATNAITSTNANFSTTQPVGTSNTTIATTQFVQQEISSSRIRSLVLSSGSGSINVTSPSSQYREIIQAFMPANTVPSGTQFYLIINNQYAVSGSSVSGSRWISAYQWGTLSVSTSTTIYDSSLGYRLVYQSNGTSWNYTGSWSYV